MGKELERRRRDPAPLTGGWIGLERVPTAVTSRIKLTGLLASHEFIADCAWPNHQRMRQSPFPFFENAHRTPSNTVEQEPSHSVP